MFSANQERFTFPFCWVFFVPRKIEILGLFNHLFPLFLAVKETLWKTFHTEKKVKEDPIAVPFYSHSDEPTYDGFTWILLRIVAAIDKTMLLLLMKNLWQSTALCVCVKQCINLDREVCTLQNDTPAAIPKWQYLKQHPLLPWSNHVTLIYGLNSVCLHKKRNLRHCTSWAEPVATCDCSQLSSIWLIFPWADWSVFQEIGSIENLDNAYSPITISIGN